MKKILIGLLFIPMLAFARGNHNLTNGHSKPYNPPVSAQISLSTLNAYVTGYGWPDNSPPGAQTYLNGVSGTAGGLGTYTSPITLAVGYVGSKGDFPYGTIFYIPSLQKYFVAQDTCAACHTQKNGQQVHLDLWVGGQGGNINLVYACEDAITGDMQVIENPANNLPVIQGSIFNGNSCIK